MTGQPHAPIGSREAWEFEQLAGCSFLDAVRQLEEGTLPVRPAAVAMLTLARRTRPTTTIDQVLDHQPWFADLIASGAAALQTLAADPPADSADDGEG